MNQPTIKLGTRLQVYKNLTTGTWSAKARIPHPKTGKMVWRKVWGGLEISLENVIAKASIKGALRIVKNDSREVVAWIEGDFAGFHSTPGGREVHYNPFRRSDFHLTDGSSFEGAPSASFPAKSAFFLMGTV